MCEKSMYNLLSTLATLFLIGSSSFLQIRKTNIISLMSSKFDTIRPRTAELAACERLKNYHRVIMGEMLLHSRAFIFDWIFFILAGNKDNHNSLNEFEFQLDFTTDSEVSCH